MIPLLQALYHPVVMTFLGIAFLVFFFVSVIYKIRTGPQKRANQAALRHQAHQLGIDEGDIFVESNAVQNLILTYMRIVKKHGKDSEEAKAFRFSTDSPALRKLYKNNKAIEAFNRVADLVDKAES